MMIRQWLARKTWAEGEPVYMTDPEGAVFRLPATDEHGMVSGEDLEAFLADAGISVAEWVQMGIKHRERRIKQVLAISAAIGLIGAVLIVFGGWISLVGGLVAVVAVVASGWAVAMTYWAGRAGQ